MPNQAALEVIAKREERLRKRFDALIDFFVPIVEEVTGDAQTHCTIEFFYPDPVPHYKPLGEEGNEFVGHSECP